MREVQSSEAKTHLPRLLDDVERGEEIVITRHGRAIARLVPEPDYQRADIRKAIDELKAFRKSMPRLTLDEILSARRAGQK
jgi:prevent-host-death family protein